MKIGAINNQSFGAIYIEQNGKEERVTKKNYKKALKHFDVTRSQKNTIKQIFKNPRFTNKLVNDLENIDTDIYIQPQGLDSVGLKLYTDIGFFGTRVTPYDGRYTSSIKTSINPNLQNSLIMNYAISNFFKRASEIDLGSDKNIDIFNRALQNPQLSEEL